MVHLENDCEATSTTLMLPGHSQLIKEDNSILATNHGKLFKLNYTQIQDFHLIQQILPRHLSDSELAIIDKSIPDVKHHSIPVMKQKLQDIITDYPYVLPEYLKILLSGLSTLVIIGIIIIVWFFKKKGCTTLSTGFRKPQHSPYLPNAPSKDVISEAPVQAWRPPTSGHRTSCKIEEIELEPMLQRTTLPVPPDSS